MTMRRILSGFRDEIEKIAAPKKPKGRSSNINKITSGKKEDDKKGKNELGKRWREGSPFGQQTDDPRDIAIPYERDGTSAQHMSPEAANSENDEGSR